MSSEGFIKPIITGTNHWYGVSMRQFAWAKKLQGTKVMVTRLKKNDQYTEVFGSIAMSTLNDDESREEFPYVVIINMEDMLKVFQKSINQLEIFDNVDRLELGDVLRFTAEGQQFQFQITDKQAFGHAGSTLYRFTLQGLVETNSHKV